MEVEIEGEKFVVEDKLYKKLEFMADRVTKPHPSQDACIENSGYEGEGKTTAAVVEAAVVKKLTNRKINLFFTTESARIFMQNTEGQLVILDEPSLDALSSDANTGNVKNLLRLTSTMRKKRHFLIINFAKFWKFPEFLVVDRALGMVHLYSRHGIDPGRFLYIRKRNLEALWNAYKKQGKREYAKLKSFGGRMPDVMAKIFNKLDIRVEGIEHATLKDYEEQKDIAIAKIGIKKSKKEIKLERDMKILRLRVFGLSKKLGISQGNMAKALGINKKTYQDWAFYDPNSQNIQENEGFEGEEPAFNIISMAKEDNLVPSDPIIEENDEENDENGL